MWSSYFFTSQLLHAEGGFSYVALKTRQCSKSNQCQFHMWLQWLFGPRQMLDNQTKTLSVLSIRCNFNIYLWFCIFMISFMKIFFVLKITWKNRLSFQSFLVSAVIRMCNYLCQLSVSLVFCFSLWVQKYLKKLVQTVKKLLAIFQHRSSIVHYWMGWLFPQAFV